MGFARHRAARRHLDQSGAGDRPTCAENAVLLALVTLIAQLATLAIFFAFVFPTNLATRNWTVIPDNWEQLRWQWEMDHAVNAVIAFAGFCALATSVLTTRD